MEAEAIEKIAKESKVLLGNGKVRQAIQLMQQQLPEDSQAYIDLMKQKAAFTELQSQNNNNLISAEQYSIHHSRIVHAMLNLTVSLPKSIHPPQLPKVPNETNGNPGTAESEDTELMYKIIGWIVFFIVGLLLIYFIYTQIFS